MGEGKARLPTQRLELKLPDAKPPLSAGGARLEASRCLYCHDAPCIAACPTGIDIPTFIRKISTGNRRGSARTILDANILGYSCARVCPVEVLCVGACVYNPWGSPPIQIGKLQRYATESYVKNGTQDFYKNKPSTGKRIALIGGGPASLSCAAYLSLEGHETVIFEKEQLPGGLNTSGVAPYKLHAEDSLREVEFIRSFGVTIRTGVEVGKDVTAQGLLEEFDAVFIGVGLGNDLKLEIPGEEGDGIVGAIDFIRRLKLDSTFDVQSYKNVLVVGGGNTAIDVVRELCQLGVPSVKLVYRRSLTQMPGYDHEWNAARFEGAEFIEKSVPVRIERKKGKLVSTSLAPCENGNPVSGNEREVSCDLMVVAIGQNKAQQIAAQFPNVRCNEKGWILIDPDTGQTGHPSVFSGGDCINGGKEVVNAVQDGKVAATTIHRNLTGEKHLTLGENGHG